MIDPEAVDITNLSGVASGGDDICFVLPVPQQLTPKRALVMAAWIVAIADSSDDHAVFNRILQRVEST